MSIPLKNITLRYIIVNALLSYANAWLNSFIDGMFVSFLVEEGAAHASRPCCHDHRHARNPRRMMAAAKLLGKRTHQLPGKYHSNAMLAKS